MKRLIGVCVALTLLLGAGVAYARGGGVGSLPAFRLRSSYPSYEQVSSWDFMLGEYRALAKDDMRPQLIFGSSELKSAPAGPAHPGRLFDDGRYGCTSVVVGRAGVNDLWQAIEVGAFAPNMPRSDRRAVIFVSMQWFMCYRDPDTTFPGVFSQGAYDAFMANPRISRGLKGKVAQRVDSYGVKHAEAHGVSAEGLVGSVDRAASSLASDLRLAAGLRSGTPDMGAAAIAGRVGVARERRSASPDWEALIAEGRSRASKASAGNEYGFYDSWYREKFKDWLAGAQRSWQVRNGMFFSRQEFDDLQLTLDVCQEAGVEPLVVIQPVKGKAYDQTIYTREVREAYYATVRAMCDRAGVEVADFSGYEYDPLFLRDYSHPSAYGSALYSQALFEFWTK